MTDTRARAWSGDQPMRPRSSWLAATMTAARERHAWRDTYVRRIAVADAVCAAVAALVGYGLRFGTQQTPGGHADMWLLVLLPFVWTSAMLVARTYEKRYLWLGPEEFRRIFFASALLLASVGTVSWAFRLEVARGFVVIALPLTTVLTLAQRFAQRKWVHKQRRAGRFLQSAILVGHRSGVAALHAQMEREPYQGYRVIGCCVPQAREDVFHGIPVLGDLDEVVHAVRRHKVDTVAVLPSAELEGPALRRLGWELEKTSAELLLAPSVTEIAGPRVSIRPVCGLPLLHVERPELRGVRRLAKAVLDRTGAAVLVAVLLPLLVGVALAIKLTSSGPVLFRQERVGRDGRVFWMLKFRTMGVDADRVAQELAQRSDGNGVLFKMRMDPRVTRVGRFLRRYSLDELPQLLNVLRGDMSLVGPRPPLQREVELYGFDMHRRFLMKPGLTGLWQVSGRSDLSWEDSVRIDVRYVENWSLTFDLMIMWKTIGAVLRGPGAY
ncbi:sugar transferase [Modestobacter excelsi]|uniref:sugar transferase n=1 Tax=Modestobacter excelsi TaxID=2213161 RepID=UPI001C20C764|nr:sugar transferase [Modestobacter excelsi]